MDESKELLAKLVNAYRPTWHYETGKVGYECGFCRCTTKQNFWEPENHQSDCALIQAHKVVMAQEASSDAITIDLLTAGAGAIT